MPDPEHTQKHLQPDENGWTRNPNGAGWSKPVDPEILACMPKFSETFLDMTPWGLFVRDIKSLRKFLGF